MRGWLLKDGGRAFPEGGGGEALRARCSASLCHEHMSPTGEKKGSRMKSLALVQQPLIDQSDQQQQRGRTSPNQDSFPRVCAPERKNGCELARTLASSHWDRPGRPALSLPRIGPPFESSIARL